MPVRAGAGDALPLEDLGPLLDRFDLHVEVPVQTGEVLLGSGEAGESSASVRERVLKARAAQRAGEPECRPGR